MVQSLNKFSKMVILSNFGVKSPVCRLPNEPTSSSQSPRRQSIPWAPLPDTPTLCAVCALISLPLLSRKPSQVGKAKPSPPPSLYLRLGRSPPRRLWSRRRRRRRHEALAALPGDREEAQRCAPPFSLAGYRPPPFSSISPPLAHGFRSWMRLNNVGLALVVQI